MILDSIISETTQRGTVLMPNVDTNKAVDMFGKGLPFRGLLKDVRGTTNGELLAKAKLDWTVSAMPVGVIGNDTVKLAEGYQGLVRSDTMDTLSITSDSFKIHQNSQIMADMQAMAEAGDAHIVFAGPLDGGRKIVAIARLEGEFALPDKRQRSYVNNHAGSVEGEDKTMLFVIISGGHEVGTPCKIRAMAFRRWCLNGAFFTVLASSTYSRTHRGDLQKDRGRLRECYDSIRAEFSVFGETAAKLQAVEMEKEQQRLYVAELLKPGIAKTLGERLAVTADKPLGYAQVWKEVSDSMRGRDALKLIIRENEETAGFARTGKNLMQAIVNQDGGNGANLWTGYNGITEFVDHKRGRSDESGMDAALFGSGATLKVQALETAVQFIQ